jgi:hypothetical protein
MRQLLVLLSAAALAMGAIDAALGSVLLRTPGAEFVEVSNGNGRAAVTGRGALNIQIDRGEIRIVDLADPGRRILSCRSRVHRVSARTVEIRGRDVRCLVWSGSSARWQAIMTGRGISASGSVRGSLTLDAAERRTLGRYRIAGRSWQRWPRSAHTYVLRSK